MDIGSSKCALGRSGEVGSEVRVLKKGIGTEVGEGGLDSLDSKRGLKVKARKAAVGRFNERVDGGYLRDEDVIAMQSLVTSVFMSKVCGCMGLKTSRAFAADEVVGQYTGDIVTGIHGLNRDYMVQLMTKSGDFIEVDGTPRNNKDTDPRYTHPPSRRLEDEFCCNRVHYPS